MYSKFISIQLNSSSYKFCVLVSLECADSAKILTMWSARAYHISSGGLQLSFLSKKLLLLVHTSTNNMIGIVQRIQMLLSHSCENFLPPLDVVDHAHKDDPVEKRLWTVLFVPAVPNIGNTFRNCLRDLDGAVSRKKHTIKTLTHPPQMSTCLSCGSQLSKYIIDFVRYHLGTIPNRRTRGLWLPASCPGRLRRANVVSTNHLSGLHL